MLMFESVTAVNRYAMRTIQDAEKKDAPPPYSLMTLNPFRTGLTKQEVIIGAFTSAMDTFATTIQRLILEVEATLHNFDTFEKHACAVRHGGAVASGEFSIGNRILMSMCRGRQTPDWLEILGDYQKQTQAHLVAVLQALNSTSVDMEDLQERVAAPEVVDKRIPLHVQIESIQGGLQRLQDARVRAKEKEEEVMRRVLGLGAD